MDGDNKAVLDLRIRQAMNYGFDRQKWLPICEIIWTTVNGIIPTGLPSNNDKGYTYDSERKAKDLVNEYKKATGDKTP
jgi:peptide/nickel transport system substrate-binding protein